MKVFVVMLEIRIFYTRLKLIWSLLRLNSLTEILKNRVVSKELEFKLKNLLEHEYTGHN